MTLSKLSRSDALFPIEQTLDRFWTEFFNSNPLDSLKGSSRYPKMTAFEDAEGFKVQFAVPGLTESDLEVEVDKNNVLTLRGQKTSTVEDGSRHYYVKELCQSSFVRSIQLPDNLEGDPAVNWENGLLSLTWFFKKKIKGLENNVRKIELKK